jgi:hypothetical protein
MTLKNALRTLQNGHKLKDAYGRYGTLDPLNAGEPKGDGVRKNEDRTVTGRRRGGHGHGTKTLASL